ncbi:unnamed protein product, partial [Adineta steineri]
FKLDYTYPPKIISSYSSLSNYVGDIQPFYQKNKKFSLIPTESFQLLSRISSIGIHTIDENSTNISENNTLKDDSNSLLLDELKLSSKSKTSSNSTVNQSKSPSKSSSSTVTNGTVISSPDEGNLVIQGKHRLSNEIERIVQDHLKYVHEDVSHGWDLIHQEGEMKVYRREVEENGIVVDPLKCFHTIKV